MNGEARSDDSTKTVLIIVGAVVGALLLVVLACGGLFYLVFRTVTNTAGGMMATMQAMMTDMQESETAAGSFLNDLAANKPDLAYDSASHGFQARQTKEEFRKFVEQNPQVKQAAAAQHVPTQNNVPGGRMVYQYQLAPNGPGTCTLQLIKEEGRWHVDALTVP